jgi:hypothetical protein
MTGSGDQQLAELSARVGELERLVDVVEGLQRRVAKLEAEPPDDHLASNALFLNAENHVE